MESLFQYLRIFLLKFLTIDLGDLSLDEGTPAPLKIEWELTAQGESCDDYCKQGGKACDLAALQTLNSESSFDEQISSSHPCKIPYLSTNGADNTSIISHMQILWPDHTIPTMDSATTPILPAPINSRAVPKTPKYPNFALAPTPLSVVTSSTRHLR